MPETIENKSIGSELYPCTSCGASLKYKPGTNSLHCEYCGAESTIETQEIREIQELDFYRHALTVERLNTQTKKVIDCRKCGAKSTFEENIKSSQCPYCNTPFIESDTHEERLIQPSYLLPFKVADKELQNYLNAWLKSRLFAPKNLKKRALLSDNLQGVYIPCWTYDARTETDYTGMRGDNYTVTVGSGKERRTETKTRWSHRSGHISLFFDDIMIPASGMVPKMTLNKLQNWDMKNLAEADNRFLSGFITEKYGLNATDGYKQAKQVMEPRIDRAVRQDIGGDKQQVNSKNTRFCDVKFKLILLPVYIACYSYHNQLYHFFVNGRTGYITGERPYSPGKIMIAVLIGIGVITLLFLWLNGDI
jgi:hypothetical protein